MFENVLLSRQGRHQASNLSKTRAIARLKAKKLFLWFGFALPMGFM